MIVTGHATYLMFSIVSGINMGSSVVLAQAYGSGDRENFGNNMLLFGKMEEKENVVK